MSEYREISQVELEQYEEMLSNFNPKNGFIIVGEGCELEWIPTCIVCNIMGWWQQRKYYFGA